MRPDVAFDWDFANGHGDLIQRIVATNAGRLLELRAANEEEDMKRATDLVLSLDTGDVALRVRRDGYDYRDLTLRYKRRVGDEWIRGFEVDKILKGFARWYLYIWADDPPDWIFVDLDRVRLAGLIEAAIERERIQVNRDGCTSFTWLTIPELIEAKALVASSTWN